MKYLSIISLLVFVSCKNYEYQKYQGFAQGTSYNITLENNTGVNYNKAIDSILIDFNKTFSLYDSTSLICRINRNDSNAGLNEQFINVFNLSQSISKISDGLFDITVNPLVKAWGFGTKDTTEFDTTAIAEILKYTGYRKINLQNNQLIKNDPRIEINMNAIAQGYSCDVMAAYFDQEGLDNYLIEIGGEVRAKGKNSRGIWWNLGIDRPEEGNFIPGSNMQAIISLQNASVATSGNYRKFIEINGKKFSHTLNPITGHPVQHSILSATIVASDCATADAVATACMASGLDKAIKIVENMNLNALFVYAAPDGTFKTYKTKGMQQMIVDEIQ